MKAQAQVSSLYTLQPIGQEAGILLIERPHVRALDGQVAGKKLVENRFPSSEFFRKKFGVVMPSKAALDFFTKRRRQPA